MALQPKDLTLLMNDRQLLEALQLHIKGRGTNAKNDEQRGRLVAQFTRLIRSVRTTYSLGSHDLFARFARLIRSVRTTHSREL